MANQISQFFESQPDRDEAVEAVRNHLTRFWEPRMRDAIIHRWREGGHDLREIAAAAVAQLAEQKNAAA